MDKSLKLHTRGKARAAAIVKKPQTQTSSDANQSNRETDGDAPFRKMAQGKSCSKKKRSVVWTNQIMLMRLLAEIGRRLITISRLQLVVVDLQHLFVDATAQCGIGLSYGSDYSFFLWVPLPWVT